MSRGHDLDALVVGAGSAGAVAALALAQAGLRVRLIDRRELDRAGAAWINAVPGWCFDRARIARPQAPVRWGGEHFASSFHAMVQGGDATVKVAEAPTLHVDMRHLVRRLHDEARQAGVVVARDRLESVDVSGRRVASVTLASGTVRPALIVDASGLGGAVRAKVPELAARCPAPDPHDVCTAAQETFEVTDPDALRAHLASFGAQPGDAVAVLGSAGGYSTLTLFTEPTLREAGVLTGSIPSMGQPNGAQMLARYVESHRWLGARRFGGRGAIPLRRPYACLGRAGVALVGDAACQVYGAHGSGVGMGMIAARMLADAVSRGSDPGADEGLGRYERRFHRAHHGLLAAADAFRRYSQGLEAADLRRLLATGLFDEALFASGLDQALPDVDPRWLVGMARKVASHPRVALAAAPAVARVLTLQRLGGALGVARGERPVRMVDEAIARMVGPSAP